MTPLKAPPHTPCCLNCHHPFDDGLPAFCPACGQKVRDTPLPIKAFFEDFVQDYFTVDAKFFKSIGLLFFRPGALTAQFNRGKRKSFIAPFRFYIFTSVIYFTLLALSGVGEGVIDIGSSEGKSAQLASIDSLMADSSMAGNREALNAAYREARSNAERASQSSLEADMNFLEKRAKRIEENPERFGQALFRAASFGAFFLLPVFALILMAVNYRKSRYYVNHLVFSVHFHTYIFVSFTLALLLSGISDALTVAVFTVIAGAYTFLAGLKAWRMTSQNKFRAFAKWFLYAVFAASLIYAPIFGESAEYIMVFFAAVAYMTLAMVNAYGQGVGRAIVKSLIVLPVYVFALFAALMVTAFMGVVLF